MKKSNWLLPLDGDGFPQTGYVGYMKASETTDPNDFAFDMDAVYSRAEKGSPSGYHFVFIQDGKEIMTGTKGFNSVVNKMVNGRLKKKVVFRKQGEQIYFLDADTNTSK